MIASETSTQVPGRRAILENAGLLAYIPDMPRPDVINLSTGALAEPTVVPRPTARRRQLAHEGDIVARAEAAKSRQSGIDVTDVSDELLVADLLRRQVRA